MIITIIASLLFGMLILTTLGGLVEVAYDMKQHKSTKPETWVIPGIFAGLFWFFSHI